MEDIDVSSLVVGNPPPVFDPYDAVQLPPVEIEQLKTASAAGDLAVVESIFSSLLTRPPAEQIKKHRLIDSLWLALANHHLPVVSFLLSQGVPMNVYHFIYAVEKKLYHFLQLFLDYGWDINEPINLATPPPLM